VAETEKKVKAGTLAELDSLEKDAIGEILNISMGAAATAISTMLDRKVEITTPVVSLVKAESFECRSLEPAIGIEIEYLEGLNGSNIMVMKQRDLRAIVNLLLGEESDIDSTEPLDEMHLSAASEIMNQMMGASSTALASFFGKNINISTPTQFDISQIDQKINLKLDEYIVAVRFVLKIDQLLTSEFITAMPMEFTKDLVAHAMNSEESTPAEIVPPKAPRSPNLQKRVPLLRPCSSPMISKGPRRLQRNPGACPIRRSACSRYGSRISMRRGKASPWRKTPPILDWSWACRWKFPWRSEKPECR